MVKYKCSSCSSSSNSSSSSSSSVITIIVIILIIIIIIVIIISLPLSLSFLPHLLPFSRPRLTDKDTTTTTTTTTIGPNSVLSEGKAGVTGSGDPNLKHQKTPLRYFGEWGRGEKNRSEGLMREG